MKIKCIFGKHEPMRPIGWKEPLMSYVNPFKETIATVEICRHCHVLYWRALQPIANYHNAEVTA